MEFCRLEKSHGIRKDSQREDATMRKSGHVSPAVKRQILAALDKLFASEDKRIPLSDVELADELRAQGIDVSETTVAYYRREFYQLPNAQDRADRYRKAGAKHGK